MTRYTALAVLLVVLVSGGTLCAEPPLRLEPQEGVLLLTNGQVLRGKVTQAGDHYYVALEHGEIRVRAADVELLCHDLNEGYRRRCEAIMAGDVPAHLDLADWCIRFELFDSAARELTTVIECDPTHPRIPLLERRLEFARIQASEKTTRSPVVADAVTNEDLDRMVRGMPPGAVECFTQTIQPLLLNHCSTAGCHGTGAGTRLVLRRNSLGKTPSRRLTQRNLHSAIRSINSGDPAMSPLLVNAIREHGDTKAPVFTSRDVLQYRQLVSWVYLVAQKSAPLPTETVTPQPVPLLQAPLTPAANLAPAANLTQATSGGSPSVAPTTGAPEAPKAANAAPAKKVDVFVPADPFDPEIFNRQFAPKP
jgi:hypothetical protein